MNNSTDTVNNRKNEYALCRIVGAGDFDKADLTDIGAAFYIAADNGLSRLNELGITPQLVVGDFDSLGTVPSGENVCVYPAEKDDTDMGIAVKKAIEAGFKQIELYGALGGRLDHTIANIQLLSLIAKKGLQGKIIGGQTEILAVTNDSLHFEAGLFCTVSVFALGEPAHGVNLKGLKYPLTDAVLTCDFPLGVSNEFTGKPADISVTDGTLTVIIQNTIKEN